MLFTKALAASNAPMPDACAKLDLYNSAAPESLKQAFNEVKEAAVEESGEDLKLELNRNKKVTKKEEVQENLIWE